MKILIFGLFLISDFVICKDIDLKHLKCLVCMTTMKELEAEVSKADPKKLVDVGSYRMDVQGNVIHKQVPISQSEVYISDILDNICNKMTDYVRATRKSDNRLIILNIMSPSGGMNPQMSEVDIIQDGDLNKSLEHYCSGVVEEFEDDIVSLYINNVKNKKDKLCTEISNICNNNYIDNNEDDDRKDVDDNVNPTEESTSKDKNEL